MIFGTPLTWLFAELLAIVLFLLCVSHAAKQDHNTIKILELFGFSLTAALFENAGVHGGVYDYSLARVMMFGKIPIAITMIEASIFYTSFQLVERLKIPVWGKPFVIGFFAMIQDMTHDPVAVFDLHRIGEKLQGRWNWVIHYDGAFFGIPYYNFSGWFWMMSYYAIFIYIGRWAYKKWNRKLIGYGYPFVAAFLNVVVIGSPITLFMLWAMPIFPMHTKIGEIMMLSIHCVFALSLLLIFRGLKTTLDLKKDWVVLAIPIAIHLIDMIMTVILQINIAYIPVFVVGAIHLAYLIYIYRLNSDMVRISATAA